MLYRNTGHGKLESKRLSPGLCDSGQVTAPLRVPFLLLQDKVMRSLSSFLLSSSTHGSAAKCIHLKSVSQLGI